MATETLDNPVPPEPPKQKTFKGYYSALAQHDKEFVRVAFLTGDYQAAASSAGHKNPFELLSRAYIREVLLAGAPYCTPDITARLVKPYVLQNLITEALAGNIPASKVLLELDSKSPKPKKVSYGSRTASLTAAKEQHSETKEDSQHSN